MAILDLPDTRFNTLQVTMTPVQSVATSPYTGSRQVDTNPWHARWSFSAEHVPISGRAAFLPWRAFFMALDGQSSRFRVPVMEDDQHSGAVVATVLSSSGSTNLVLATLPHSVTYLPAGSFLTVILASGDEQLICLTADLDSDGSGHAPASFYPPLRGAPDLGSTVETKSPWLVGALDDPKSAWQVSPGPFFEFTLQGSEAW